MREMKTFGMVSCNCNFTNYGSVVMGWSLGWTIAGLKFGYRVPMEATAGVIIN